jgi:ATP-binding cassette subfamily B protein
LGNKKYGLLYAFRLCFQYHPAAATAGLILAVANGLLVPALVMQTANFLDAAVTLTGSNPQTDTMLTSVALIMLIYVYFQLAPICLSYAKKCMECGLKKKLRPKLLQKHNLIEYKALEQEQIHNMVFNVFGKLETQFLSIYSDITQLISLILQIAGVIAIIIQYVWWILIVILAGSVPLLLISSRGGRRVYEMEREITGLSRLMNYFSDILTNRESCGERTIFGFSQGINDRFESIHLKRSIMNTKAIGIWTSRSKAGSMILFTVVVVCMLALSAPLQRYELSIGLYISIIGAIQNMVQSLTYSVSMLLFSASGNKEYLKDYSDFINQPEAEEQNTSPVVNAISEFKKLEIINLSFQYAGTDSYVLRDVNLCIENNQSYSLIGKNGAGKTTLIKILTGLYTDYGGQILLNGIDLKCYSRRDLISIFSVIYQDFAKYYVTLEDNVTLGGSRDGLPEILELAEVDRISDKLPCGLKQPLGKIDKDGVDLSGGEWQRIAIARALYAKTPFIIMDEPTASLSPMAESKIYREFSRITQNKTVILISHRLASTKLADRIFVLDGGRIVEEGTHEQLMQSYGLYNEMFTSQKEWYDYD